jgi:hypothetical protein
MKTASVRPSPLRVPIAGILAWVMPGAGHFFIGERGRGLIFTIAIALTFWGGVAIGGVKNTVNPQDRALWFLGQVCAGVHPFLAIAWSRQVEISAGADKARWIAYGQMEDISIVYTAIAGMLNLLVILDVLIRAERQGMAQPGGRAGPASERAGP